jgi:hypothetical protein
MNKYEQIFLEEKCDKHYHRYHEGYNAIVGDTDIKSILEIGVCWGDSLRAWRRIWPEAIVEGIDLLREYDLKLEEQFKIYNIDSTSSDLAETVNNEYDIIVDDGNHHWRYQLDTFELYYPKAKKFYVIEDIMGNHCLDKVMQFLPKDVLDRAVVFTSKARKRTFIFHDNTAYDNYRIMFIDKTWE